MKENRLRGSNAMRASALRRERFFNRWSGTRLLLVLALLLMGATDSWAQNNGWDKVYAQTQTTAANWTALTEDSETGKELGGSSTAPYYYYVKRSLRFSNKNAGGSGLTIKGDVYLYIPAGMTITCTGANASGATGAGAGIELSEGNTLHILGCGTYNTSDKKWVPTDVVIATGGNAANGCDGGTGTNATGYNGDWIATGTGGKGGDGGGGAGAGIGSRGGNGGTGGNGGDGGRRSWSENNGTNGSPGNAGFTADNMGKLYVDQTYGIRVKATGGVAASSGGNMGQRGRGYAWDGYSNNYTVSGGGGGGAGGFGGAAANIGTGGPGGGGGGGGAGGAVDKRANSKGGVYDVTAYGGKGGKNADGTNAADGNQADTTGKATDEGWVTVENGGFGSDWNKASGDVSFGAGGAGGDRGNTASNGTVNAGKLEYTITFNPIKTNLSAAAKTIKYSPSSATTVILPKNIEGYQWAMSVYGKDCSGEDTEVSEFAKPIKTFYGGNDDEESARTILLSDVYGNIVFQEVAGVCVLDNEGDNKEVINDFFDSGSPQNFPVTVRLKDRTLYKDRSWNTICLPFDMTPEQYSNSPLAGSIVFEMDENDSGYYPNGQTVPYPKFKADHPILFFYFKNANPSQKGLRRGVPYLVKWADGKNLVDNSSKIVDNTGVKVKDPNQKVEVVHQLDFPNVRVKEKIAGSIYANDVYFQGTLSQSSDLNGGDQTKLILGPKNTLYYPSETLNVGACRGYFIIPEEAVDVVKTRGVVLGFEDEKKK